MAHVTAEQLIRKFEGFSATPYWDVNAWRLGYGSDTMTDENGNVTRVKKDSTTTKDAAARDLERRITEFQKEGIIPYVGQKAWDVLPSDAKAAVTSVAYNYGGLSELRTLTAAIKAGDSEAMAGALEKYATHNGGINEKRRLAEAAIIRDAPIPPGNLGDDPFRMREAIQDRNAERLGYGEISPDVGSGRPAYFNETGAPPIPATRPTAKVTPATISPALQSARQRLQLAREAKAGTAATGTTTPAAMAATPRLTQANGQVTGIDDPRAPLDWGQFRPGVGVGGVGSLLDGGINPSALNPAQPTTTVAGRPDAPVGALPAASPAETKEAQRGGNVAPTPVVQPAASSSQTAVMPNGKTITVGKAYTIGDQTYIGGVDKNGVGTLTKVPHTLLDEAKPGTIAGGLVKSGVADAIGSAVDNLGTMVNDVGAQTAANAPVLVDSVKGAAGNLANEVGGFLGGLFGGKPAASANANLTSAQAEQAVLRKATKAATGNTLTSTFVSEDHEKSNKPVPYITPLVPSTTGNTLAKPAAPSMVKTTIANPDYAAWVAKYGDGSQVQTAPTGGMITANQLAAISGSGAPVPVAKPAIPAAPPRTITVMRPGNTLAPTPAAPKVQTAQTVSGKTVNVGQTYQSGGYLYTANANGTFTKIGKVGGSSSSGVLSSLSTSPSKSSTTTRVTTGTNVSGDQNAFSPQSVQSSERWQTGY